MRIDLCGKWLLHDEQNQEYEANVPGCVHTDIIKEDLYWRDNTNKYQWIEKCDWTYKKVSNDSRLTVGPSVYAFYGKIILSNEYYDEIVSKYQWEKMKDNTSVEFLDEIINEKDVCFNESFAGEMSSKPFAKFLLEKETKTLYFYQED